ncbi:hypothetical protein [Phenylobacterium sp.]|uniref:hypothetical protein n=1 Tax=Phenylobacterium sp. TaxID=1871053 RepID=UPI00286BEE95|nr:hypothetical protein [Phenylobacterium sp.]
MAFQTEPAPFALEPLIEGARYALAQIAPQTIGDGALDVVGPFRCYVAEPAAFARGATKEAVTAEGWRALLLQGERPVALIDVTLSGQPGAEPAVAVRGPDAATAFYKVLEAAQDIASEGDFEVRFLTMPSLFLTALWLAGPASYFLPTRAGADGRPPPRRMTRGQFIALTQARLNRMAPRAGRAEILGLDAADSASNAPGRSLAER